eukprot:704887-Amphidinium_carterae.1
MLGLCRLKKRFLAELQHSVLSAIIGAWQGFPYAAFLGLVHSTTCFLLTCLVYLLKPSLFTFLGAPNWDQQKTGSSHYALGDRSSVSI